MADGEPVALAATATLLFLSLDSAGPVCITDASPSTGRLDEVHGLSQPARHKHTVSHSGSGGPPRSDAFACTRQPGSGKRGRPRNARLHNGRVSLRGAGR